MNKSLIVWTIIASLLLLGLAGALFYATTISFCKPCTGWDTINPLCQAQYAGCNASEGSLHIAMTICSGMLIVSAVIVLIGGVWRSTR